MGPGDTCVRLGNKTLFHVSLHVKTRCLNGQLHRDDRGFGKGRAPFSGNLDSRTDSLFADCFRKSRTSSLEKAKFYAFCIGVPNKKGVARFSRCEGCFLPRSLAGKLSSR